MTTKQMHLQIRNSVTRTTDALRSALVGSLLTVSTLLDETLSGLVHLWHKTTTRNKFTITLEFEDGTTEEIHLTETEWDSIDTAAQMSDLTMEEFVLTAIKMAIEEYK